MTIKTNAKEVSNMIKGFTRELVTAGASGANRGAEIIKSDVDQSIRGKKRIDGTPRVRKLDKKTIRQKRRAGRPQPSIPLYATGTMKNILIVQAATKGRPVAILKPPRSRVNVKGFDVADHHQGGPYGPWFGISPGARLRTNTFYNELVLTEIAKFNRGR